MSSTKNKVHNGKPKQGDLELHTLPEKFYGISHIYTEKQYSKFTNFLITFMSFISLVPQLANIPTLVVLLVYYLLHHHYQHRQ